ncbi:hypothetical protein DXT99_26700 [Pontibacter diazotrophicus]|uniref:RHS repeat protein n=2 Tax=Pontibacter diazotrophicus TaxID=1400979 RepID=A0A3D8KYU1_9BACT|nr:hypothetical protein DXT99_26700 [Pontibacter diazotrophicus]
MTKTIYILTLLFLVACQSREGKQQEGFDPEYVVKSYYSNADDPENLKLLKYYDSSDRLLREIGKEGDCIRYIYDKTGKLIEKVWGRGCQQVQGVRSILFYDTLGNLLGTYTTSDTLVNMDTVNFEQIYFYDIENRLVKEKIAERVESQGDTIKTWNYYTYVGNKKDSLLVTEGNGLLWKGAYKYDTTGRLVELRKTRRDTYENEFFLYDDLGRLVEKQTITNYKFDTPVGVSAPQH